ncbi:MAG TPA: prephenate dehydrogenase [Terriglobales bacterium]|nr:prephenate dehydrogenase [Terriglobales bacterium]
MERVTIIGTGLIGASVGLALRAAGYTGGITGWDRNPEEAALALRAGALDAVSGDAVAAAQASDVVVLATPVLAILEWMERLAPVLGEQQLLTDVGSTKARLCAAADKSFNRAGRAGFLPGHPMAGKELSGAAQATAGLFEGAMWLWTPVGRETERSREWRGWVARFGCRTLDLDPTAHDELVAWASHLPQFLATALAATLEDEFGGAAEARGRLRAVGGRAMREMTRLGASPYSMWRDIAHTNTAQIAAALEALEQRLADVRNALTQPELRREFESANQFRKLL